MNNKKTKQRYKQTNNKRWKGVRNSIRMMILSRGAKKEETKKEMKNEKEKKRKRG